MTALSDYNDASIRWTRLRYTAEDAARLLAGLRDLGVSRDTLFDVVAGTLDALADAAAVNERESDERGVLQDWQGFGDACEALAEWRHWLLQNRPVRAQMTPLDAALGHLSAAKAQRAPEDDAIIAGHVDAALDMVQVARQALGVPMAAE
jgi:hypothetical protein